MISLTDSAIKEFTRIVEDQGLKTENTYLRMKLVGGGCSGFMVKLDMDEHFDENKDILQLVNGINVIVDKRSSMYLQEVSIDYVSLNLNKVGFVVDVKGASNKCGCNSSFSF